jgi:hypothetical protein
MTTFCVYDAASGRVAYFTSNRQGALDPSALQVGQAYLEIPDDTTMGSNMWQVANPHTPQAALTAYVSSLAELKMVKLNQAGAHFGSLFLLPNGFTYHGYLMQLDDDSRANISAGVNDALATKSDAAAYPFQIPYWVAADNAHMALSGPDDMIAFGRACLAYYQACRVRFRAIKDSITAAADQTALDAIDATAGYPTPSA